MPAAAPVNCHALSPFLHAHVPQSRSIFAAKAGWVDGTRAITLRYNSGPLTFPDWSVGKAGAYNGFRRQVNILV